MNKKVITTTLFATLSLTSCTSPQVTDSLLPQGVELRQDISAPSLLKPVPPAKVVKPTETPQVTEVQTQEPTAEVAPETPTEATEEAPVVPSEVTEQPAEAIETPEVVENTPEASESLTQAPAPAEHPAPAVTTAVVTGTPIRPGGNQ